MSTQYNGNGTVPTATKGWTPVAIVSSTNASPIVVTTGTHGFANGDTVGIEGHKTNTAANGLWQIAVLSSTTFSLTGSTGNGVGGATGIARDYSVQPLLTLISDGDTLSATNLNPPPEALANTTPYMYQRAGAYSVVDMFFGTSATDPPTGAAISTTTPSATTWTNCTSMTGLLSFPVYTGVLKPADLLDITFSSSVNLGGTIGTGPWAIALAYSLNGGSYNTITASSRLITQAASPQPVTLNYTGSGIASAAGGDTFNLAIQCWSDNATTNIVLFGSYQIVARQLRSNS